jgi:hypothetical protein
VDSAAEPKAAPPEDVPMTSPALEEPEDEVRRFDMISAED